MNNEQSTTLAAKEGDRMQRGSETYALQNQRVQLLGTVAEIIYRADGGPMRTIMRGRQHKAVGIYYSIKSGRSLAWESRNELHDFWRAEVRPDVIRSRAQPHTLQWVIDGQTRRYTPDREDILADGTIEITEIKNVFEAEKDPLSKDRLDFARTIYAGIGQSFRVVEKAEIEAQPQFDAIRTIQGYRRTALTDANVFTVRKLFEHRPEVTLAEVQSALSAGPHGLAIACAMMVHRILAIDLSTRLVPSAIVRINSDWA